MKRLLHILVYVLISLSARSQIDVKGIIVEGLSREPLPGASIILRNSEGKIKKYATSDKDGRFTIVSPDIKGYTLDVSMMSFAKQTIKLDSVTLPVTVRMEPSATTLKEVAVKADRIREQGDTIKYSVGSFAQAQDRSIGDVLKRMPGIDVSSTGKIQYQGEDINKFYIEGSDLLGGKYGIATNGISHTDVGSVEVMENHQPLQVLAGISFSDKAAINLKLKNKAKATWSFHGDAGGGYSWQPGGVLWDGELFAMAVMSGFQNITTLKTNNTGEDLSSNTTDFFSSGNHTALKRYVGVSLPGVPSLNRKRTLFNQSAMISTNNLWKVKNGEVKAQFDYSFDRVTASAANITTYFLNDGNRIVTENRDGRDRKHSLSGRIIYEVNQRTTFINNTLQTDIGWDKVGLDVTGSIPNEQSASLPDYFVSNRFKMIKRFKGKHLVTFESVNEWESLPQTWNGNFQIQNDFDGATSGTNENRRFVGQHVGDHAFFTNESASYGFSVKGVTVSLDAGVKAYFRSMNSELTGVPDELTTDYIKFDNVVNTNYLTVYATPKLEYWFKRVDFKLNLPVSYSLYTFDKALADRNEVYFSPSLSMNWKPVNKLSFSVRGGLGRSPMSLNMIQPGLIMTNYRSFRRGVDDFYTSSSKNVTANFSYRHTRHGVFANGTFIHSWSHLPYTQSQQLYGDYIVYSYSAAKSDSKNMSALASVGKTLDFMRGSVNVNGMYMRGQSLLISEHRDVTSVSNSWNVGLKLSGSPLRWFTFDYSIRYSSSCLSMNGLRNPWLGNMENDLLINILPHQKWEWRISGEHYRNQLTDDSYKNVLLVDTKLVYKLTKRVELSASLTNIFNRQTYNYTTYNELSSYESQRQIRGRQLLFSVSIRK